MTDRPAGHRREVRVVAASWDPLHATSPPGRHWSRANIGEALPGVLTPLTWSLWEVAAEGGTRAAFHALGAASKRESVVPEDRAQRFIRAFYGRGAAQLEFLCGMGDRIPGTSGAAIAEQVFGSAPSGLVGRRTLRRYSVIAAKIPWTFLRAPRELRADAALTGQWWREQTTAAPKLDATGAVRLFTDARRRFHRTVALQATTLFCVVQPVYDMFERLAARAGVEDLTGLASGYGAVPETAVVGDLWRASRGDLDLTELARRHGFHGPREGELSARVWREDDSPLRRLVTEYAAMDEAQSPVRREEHLREQREVLEREILEALPPAARPAGRALLRTAGRTIPLRGIAKDSYLQASDVIRASARRIGHLLAADGTLADPDGVFFLTDDEIAGPLPPDPADLVRRRRERHAEYSSLEIPSQWVGDPVPENPFLDDVETLAGIGVSPGVVEGIARVVTDPSFEEITPGEILVAPATDPSWSSVMFMSTALVVDIGGALSHAAIVARELGVPCVVNTVTGTRSIRTGDRVRVDGSTGAVEILKRQGNTP